MSVKHDQEKEELALLSGVVLKEVAKGTAVWIR